MKQEQGNESYKIEKGIPLTAKGKGIYDKAAILRSLLLKMDVGDSVLIPKKDYYVFYNALRFSDELKKRKYTSRVDGENRRLWRTL